MSKIPPKNQSNNSDDTNQVAEKFPGLAAKKPAKSISVERPIHSDEKTVTETGIPRVDDEPARPSDPAVDALEADDNDIDETVLELPPSPEQRKIKRRRALWISILSTLVLLGGGWAVLYFSPILAIEEIEHEGLDLVTESQAVERTAGLEGKPLPQVGERGVNELFENIPAVKDVTLRAEPPHGLVVNINEYQPIAMGPRGKEYVVFSEDGTELAEITSKKAQEFDLPVVASAADVTDEDVFNTITEVLGHCRTICATRYEQHRGRRLTQLSSNSLLAKWRCGAIMKMLRRRPKFLKLCSDSRTMKRHKYRNMMFPHPTFRLLGNSIPLLSGDRADTRSRVIAQPMVWAYCVLEK